MEKRTFLAIAVSIVILIAFQYISSKYYPAPVPPKQAAQTISPKEAPAVKPAQITSGQTPQGDVSAQVAQTEKVITVKTDLYTLKISNKGARIISMELAGYKDKLNGDGGAVQLISERSEKNDFYPLHLIYDQPEINSRCNNVLYESTKDDLLLSANNPQGTISLFYTDPAGIKITKDISFSNENYYIGVSIKQKNLGAKTVAGHYYLAWGYDLGREILAGSSHQYVGPTTYLAGELKNDKPSGGFGCSAPKETPDFKTYHKGEIAWTALQDTYFAGILIPKNTTSEAMVKSESGNTLAALGSNDNQIAPGAEAVDNFGIYAGPKKIENLAPLNKSLDKIIDYGWFDALARPLLQFIKFSHKFTKSYGWDIIILTVLIKLIFYPLTASGFKSMRKMQALQPKMTALRKKFKDDPQKLNQEIMELYKKNKVNPLGGCLPMILQIPVFFALYKALLMSIELRHAPFVPFDRIPFTNIVWLADLSAKDPFYVTPILMGISMFIQQKMTPSTGDKAQANMMLMMPVIFTFMFLSFPSGLVIYWLLNNVLGIAQQYMINKQETAKEAQ